MGDFTSTLVRVAHIFLGVFWVGATLTLAGFIEPALKAMKPDGQKVMQRMMGPGKFPVAMSASATITTITGLVLLWTESNGNLGDWFGYGYGISIALGSIIGVVAYFSGLSINAPAATRMARLGAAIAQSGAPPTSDQLAEMERLQHRLGMGSVISAILLSLSVVGMAAAHFL